MEPKNEIIIYQSQDGSIKVDVLFSEETVWLTQMQIGSLFGKAKSTISEHIKNIFEEGKLNENMRRNFTGQPLLYFYFFYLFEFILYFCCVKNIDNFIRLLIRYLLYLI